jgi:hypothetical protein
MGAAKGHKTCQNSRMSIFTRNPGTFSDDNEYFELPGDLRKVMCWGFLCWAIRDLALSLRSIVYLREHSFSISLNPLSMPIFTLLVALICGAAWLTIWQNKAGARVWALLASVMLVLVFVRQFVIPVPILWHRNAPALISGVIGLIAFLRPTKNHTLDPQLPETD